MKIDCEYTTTRLMPKDTIDSLIKLFNQHDLKYVQMVQLRHLVYALNKKDIFIEGEEVKIPTLYKSGRIKDMRENIISLEDQRSLKKGKEVVEVKTTNTNIDYSASDKIKEK